MAMAESARVGDALMAGGYRKMNQLELFTMREDGLASLHAGAEAGYVITKPFQQAGSSLRVNFATSAAGSLKVEVLDGNGHVLAGYSGEQAGEIFGDSLEYEVRWKGGRTWAELEGRVVRLRLSLHDADLYSLAQR